MNTILRKSKVGGPVVTALLFSCLRAYAQGARFLVGDLRQLVQSADIQLAWVEGTDKFWYLKPGHETKFRLVDMA